MDFLDSNINNMSGSAANAGFGRGYGWHSSLRYDNPFLDLASFYLPRTIKELNHLVRFYYLKSPIINPIVRKMATYPVTKTYIETGDQKINDFWENYSNNVLRIPEFQINCGIDYHVYGNCYAYIHFPIIKTLICPSCRKEEKIQNCHYRWINLNYELHCSRCGMVNKQAGVKDHPKRSANEITLNRLPPELIDIENNPITGRRDYFLTLPRITRNEILIGKKVQIEELPDVFIDSMRKNKKLLLTPGKIFHFQRSSISHLDYQGYGEPMLWPVLTDMYYFQILRKAQEAILKSAIVPLRFVFPQSGDSQTSPYTNVNLLRWMNNMKTEFVKWRRDSNHVGFVPIPVGSQVVGADGKALVLFQELEIQANLICNGMGVPLEFYKGGLSWSGSNMSLRMMQTEFVGYRDKLKVLTEDFILGNIADYLGKNRPKISFGDFKMADDLQRSALEHQLYQSRLISADTLLKGMDHNSSLEKEKINNENVELTAMQRKDQIAQANIAGEAQLIQAKWSAQAQKKVQMMSVQPQLAAQGTGQQNPMQTMNSQGDKPADFDQEGLARTANNELSKMNDYERNIALNKIRMEAPDIFATMMQLQSSGQGNQDTSIAPPEVKPSRAVGV